MRTLEKKELIIFLEMQEKYKLPEGIEVEDEEILFRVLNKSVKNWATMMKIRVAGSMGIRIPPESKEFQIRKLLPGEDYEDKIQFTIEKTGDMWLLLTYTYNVGNKSRNFHDKLEFTVK
ncbi:MAG: hypothetical protein EU549_03395 [Promethearchaeota archaeon]|nr:MAG: hypothetical protein EU549_03395 [Candidatus Lokiarchaeota archaeon]